MLKKSKKNFFFFQTGITNTAFSSLGNRERPPQMIEAGDTILLEDPTVAKIAKKHNRTNAQV